MIIKNVFDGKCDEEVHSNFLKFGKGEFKNKYLIEAKKQKDKWTIKTGPEFANYLVKKGLEKVKGKIKISGVIVSTFDLRDKMGGVVFSQNEEIKQFMGIKQLKVDSEIESTKILEVITKFPRAFFALSFILPDYELKIKPKAPKSAKPSTNGEKEQKPEFCSLKTSDGNFIKEMFFDCPNFNEISINHTIKINEMIYPKNFATMKPEEVREQSKRKGILIREIIADGKSQTTQANFEA